MLKIEIAYWAEPKKQYGKKDWAIPIRGAWQLIFQKVQCKKKKKKKEKKEW